MLTCVKIACLEGIGRKNCVSIISPFFAIDVFIVCFAVVVGYFLCCK